MLDNIMGANSTSFSFSTFAPNGDCRLTARPSLDVLRSQDHLVPILDSISDVLTARPASATLVFSIAETEPFRVEWAGIGSGAGVAGLFRAESEAVLIAVAGSIDDESMRSLHTRLRKNFGGAALDGAFKYLRGCATPAAAQVYIRGEPQVGMDTLGICVAAVFIAG
jgi:hypothetical protein